MWRRAINLGLMLGYLSRIIPVMNRTFSAVIKQDEGWWIGWVTEVPGVNSQGRTREDLLANLRSALQEALEMNRGEAR
jgi:predicted RNase H-like HicB family nuclease